MDIIENIELFPLSKTSKITGKRRIIREKILQILVAYEICESPLDLLFNHIFYREFNFGDESEVYDKLLNKEEIEEVEADFRISWPKAELQFAKDLLNTILENLKAFERIIIESADNWEFDRIAYIDKKIMSIAICEIMFFSDIPPKVSINEAIDLAKKYSTEKSGNFINGVLDKVLVNLTKEGKVSKTGKGLRDH